MGKEEELLERWRELTLQLLNEAEIEQELAERLYGYS
ncbi:hypothetical protein NUACC26_021300 [Scytonema sp. NUACC26]